MNQTILTVKTLSDSTLVVDSRLIAKELDVEHRSFFKTIKKYQNQTEQSFGILRFEIAEINGKGQPEKFAYLTEDQATFLMTLSRNSDRVVNCKVQLVKQFSLAKKILANKPQEDFYIPKTYADALRFAAEQLEKNEKLEAKIKEDEPKVALAEAISFSDTSVSFNEYAKLINTGRTRLFRQMRECGVVMKSSTLPYQSWIDAGYFEVSQEILGDGKLIPFALVTGKGQLWLKQRLDAHIALQKKVIGSIAQGVLDMSI